MITEVGGTVGDIEILPFLEAIRQFRLDVGRAERLLHPCHPGAVHRARRGAEDQADPASRSPSCGAGASSPTSSSAAPIGAISDGLREKISSLCDVPIDGVINAPDADSLYGIPLVMHEAGLDSYVGDLLGIEAPEADLADWRALVDRTTRAWKPLKIGIVGKYVSLHDAYLSVAESLRHASVHHGVDIEIEWISSDHVEGLLVGELLGHLDGIVLPGGFGVRGVEGKIAAAAYSRDVEMPCLGLCLGMQVMTIEFARNVLGLSGANSSEFDTQDRTTPDPVIDLMESQQDVTDMGGTMRLGAYVAVLDDGSQVADIYGDTVVSERHRHRYEFNPRYKSKFEAAGFRCSGTSPDGLLVEFIELEGHPFWIGTQAHPELKSRPDRPAPLFEAFIGAGPGAGRAARPRAVPAGPTGRQRLDRWRPGVIGVRGCRWWWERRPGGHRRRPHRMIPVPRVDDLPAVEQVFQSVDEKLVHQGAIVSFGGLVIEGPDGDRFDRDVIRHPGAVAVVAVAGADGSAPEVYLVNQYRASVDGNLWEIPAGKRDVHGEPPDVTAHRELAEEVGLAATSMELLLNVHHSPGFTDEYGFIFLATGLTQVPQQLEGPEEQHIVVVRVPLGAAADMVFDGRITDAKSAAGILAAARRLGV